MKKIFCPFFVAIVIVVFALALLFSHMPGQVLVVELDRGDTPAQSPGRFSYPHELSRVNYISTFAPSQMISAHAGQILPVPMNSTR